MRVLIAPDNFKGSLSAAQAVAALAEPQYVLCEDEDMMIGHESGSKNCWMDNRQFDAGGVKTSCLRGTLKKPC